MSPFPVTRSLRVRLSVLAIGESVGGVTSSLSSGIISGLLASNSFSVK